MASPTVHNAQLSSTKQDAACSSKQVPKSLTAVAIAGNNNASRMRSHKGNIPSLPQTKQCPLCPAKFTRTTHLNRHLRSHTNERLYRCNLCQSQFTRSDLLTRHKRTCGDSLNANRSRRKSCQACVESKIKCDLKQPCSKCASRGRECFFVNDPETTRSRSTSTPAGNSDHAPPANDPSPVCENDLGRLSRSPSFLLPALSELWMPTPSATPNGMSSPVLSSPSTTVSTPRSDVYDSERDFPISSFTNSMADQRQAGLSNIFSTDMLTSALGDNPYPRHLNFGSSHEFLAFNSYPFKTQSVDHQFCDDLSEFAMTSASMPNNPCPETVLASSSKMTEKMVDVNSPPSSASSTSSYGSPSPDESQHYLYLFFSAFLPQIPILHSPTWHANGKPLVLVRAMQVCGALFVKTRSAQNFVSETLRSSREALVHEFVQNPEAAIDQGFLVLAVVLLQTVGLFHQRVEERISSSIYHGMVVMMIRRSGLIEKNAFWAPPDLSDASSLDRAWREWASYETIKRALLLSHMHDCCQSIYFSLPPSFARGEMHINLPCEDALWSARTAKEWFNVLQSSSPYGCNIPDRLVGYHLHHTLSTLAEIRQLSDPRTLNAFSLFILIHTILGDMYAAGLRSKAVRPSLSQESVTGAHRCEGAKENLCVMQHTLNGWLQCWLNRPEVPRSGPDNDEPRFMLKPLSFYWLAQISLMAFQQGIPPLSLSESGRNIEAAFRLVKRWLCHIRSLLRKGDQQALSVMWEDLMRIRLQTWESEVKGGGLDPDENNDGLLAFFA